MSKVLSADRDSHSPRLTADSGRSSADCCSEVPPTQQLRRDGEAAQIAIATENTSTRWYSPARLAFGS
jgi:hypothetical protein